MEILKKILQRQPKLDKNKNIFFVFLLLASLIWLLTNLSKEYTNAVTFNIEYINQPKTKLLYKDLTKQIKVVLKAQGFSLLSYKLSPKKITIDLNKIAYKEGDMYYYLPNNHLAEFETQLSSNVLISRILKDTIFIGLSTKITKKVPIISKININYKLGYSNAGALILSPDSVAITGMKKAIDTINHITTKNIDLKGVDSNLDIAIDLMLPKISEVNYSDTTIHLKAKVEKFTEGEFEVPFKIINLPKGYQINTFPKEVTVKYQVALSNFSKVSASNFKVVCDYNQTKSSKISYLIPKVVTAPLIVSQVNVAPQKIEFLLKK